MVEFLKRKTAPDLAYVKIEASETSNHILPTIMFLGGFRSDMQGTKATYLEGQCKKRGQAYIRFDYRGHGESGGEFKNSCISDWTQDALDILQACTSGSVILVGSSMGGWISFLMALQNSKRIGAIVGLAAAPDFTIWIEKSMNVAQRTLLQRLGYFEMPNDYDNVPYIITQKLLEDGQRNALLDGVLNLSMPVRLIQGMKDMDVDWQVATYIKDMLPQCDTEIILLEDADHRLSSSDQLEVLNQTICCLQK